MEAEDGVHPGYWLTNVQRRPLENGNLLHIGTVISPNKVTFFTRLIFHCQKQKLSTMTQITVLSAEPGHLVQQALFKLCESRRNRNREAHVVRGQRNYLGE